MSNDALLDAALEQFALTGIRRTSADDIAQRAGVNRATLYRRLGTKEQIVSAALLHETSKVLTQIESETGQVPDPDDAAASGFDNSDYLVRFFSVTITALRSNPLLEQLLAVDRTETLSGLTLHAGPVLTVSAQLVADRIRALRVLAGRTPTDGRAEQADDTEMIAITLARLAQSLVITREAAPRLDTPSQLRAYAEAVIVPWVLR